MKRRLTLVTVLSSLLALAAQPAFASIVNMAG